MLIQIPPQFNPAKHPDINIVWQNGLFKVVFEAMASPCSLFIELDKEHFQMAKNIALLAAIECWRIEYKYSRYQKNNFFCELHSMSGSWFKLDKESQRLMNFANTAWQLSDGLFDISSGVLRQAWQFNTHANLPKQAHIDELLGHIGWHKVQLDPIKGIKLPLGMELDFGGIGKEYAVDRVLQLITDGNPELPCLVNFGGDIACNKSRSGNQPWHVGIDSPFHNDSQLTLSLTQGALATSGDRHRFIEHEKKRYSHVLNPKSGWPIEGGPRSITLAAPTCIQAGLMATLALLQGKDAKSFITMTGFNYWIYE